MQIAVVLYDRVTALDAIGPYEILSRLPGVTLVFAGLEAGPVRADTGRLSPVASQRLDDVPAPDVILVPGSPAAPTGDGRLLDWLRAADAGATWVTSVCTGSLVLAAARQLAGRRATTQWLAYDRLGLLGAVPVAERVVFDGKYATAAGVSAGLDLALEPAARIAGPEVAQTIQLAIEYDPAPPFNAGSPRTAPPSIVDGLRANRHLMLDA
jgi:putative intracellular protease/amidase